MFIKLSNCINLLFLGIFTITQANSSAICFVDQSKIPQKIDHSPMLSPKDSLISTQISGHWVDILYPESPQSKGNILVLPGWSFSRQDWCQKADLCKKASAEGYCLIFPEMGKSIYASQLYPETRDDWRQYPTLDWVLNAMIEQLQEEYQLLTSDQNNYLLGLSTGGRGVALIALKRPNLFKAAAALSGDFDQTKMPKDNLMRGFYGEYKKFPDRWEGVDNPQKQIEKFHTPIYLGHGKLDKIVPPNQTLHFYQALQHAHPKLKIVLHMPDAAHNYAYWGSETDAVLDFYKTLK